MSNNNNKHKHNKQAEKAQLEHLQQHLQHDRSVEDDNNEADDD